jgi:hypothetical protein
MSCPKDLVLQGCINIEVTLMLLKLIWHGAYDPLDSILYQDEFSWFISSHRDAGILFLRLHLIKNPRNGPVSLQMSPVRKDVRRMI